jgi:quercetin dioxygenase-like cupin family protein
VATEDRTDSIYSAGITPPAQLDFQPVFTRIDQVPPYSLVNGITMQSVAGNRIMMTWVTIAPNAVVPEHQHPQEQTGTVLEGVLTLVMAGESHDLGPGAIYTIPPNLPHSASSRDGCRVLDVFSPVREDFLPYAVR